MTQREKREKLIRYLLDERSGYRGVGLPADGAGQRELLRGLMNVRRAAPVSPEFLRVQDEYLQERLQERGVTDFSDLEPVKEGIYLWRGDITLLRCDAIVNAANSGMTGCYQPCHNCIDNCIHTYAGVQLRSYCSDLMERQGHPEPTGQAKITPAFNLPCKHIIHTVGPIVEGGLRAEHCRQLESCYRWCLELAEENGVKSLAFCCISTGVFGFPQKQAAEIAVDTVLDWKAENKNEIEVIFDVFTEKDEQIYRELLGQA